VVLIVLAPDPAVARWAKYVAVAEPGMPEQVVPVRMGGEPGDYREAEPVQVIGELVQLRAIDAGIDQDQPALPAHRDGIAPDPRALPDPDAVGHLIQHGVHGSLLARRTVTGSAIGLRYLSANVTVRLAPGKVQFHAG